MLCLSSFELYSRWVPLTTLRTVKRMLLILRYVLSRYFLFYNLEVSFNLHLTLLKLNVIKMFTVK